MEKTEETLAGESPRPMSTCFYGLCFHFAIAIAPILCFLRFHFGVLCSAGDRRTLKRRALGGTERRASRGIRFADSAVKRHKLRRIRMNFFSRAIPRQLLEINESVRSLVASLSLSARFVVLAGEMRSRSHSRASVFYGI